MPSMIYRPDDKETVLAWIEREQKKAKEQMIRLDEILADEEKLRKATLKNEQNS
jgi:hypothetical protein